MVDATRIPTSLKAYPQWVCWRYEQRVGQPKPTKVPYNARTDWRASSTEPATWSSFNEALERYQRGGYDGIGIVLSSTDDLVGLDLDNCIDEAGQVLPWAMYYVEGCWSYTEITPSGQGLRVFFHGKLPPGRRRLGDIEIYDQERFLTVTGNHLSGTPLEVADRSTVTEVLHEDIFGPAIPAESSAAPSPSAIVGLKDADLLERAHRAKNGADFAALWRGDTARYLGDDSRADYHLARQILWWSSGDVSRADRLFRQSGLMRPKWDERRGTNTYGERTLAAALQNLNLTYTATVTVPTDTTNGHHDLEQVARITGAAASTASQPPSEPPTMTVSTDFVWDCFRKAEFGDAQLMARLYSGKLLWEPAEKEWYTFNGHHWQRDTTDLALRAVPSVVAGTYLSLAATVTSESEREVDEDAAKNKRSLADELVKRAKQLQHLNRTTHVLKFAQGMLTVPGGAWDSDPWLLGVVNGVIDLRSGTLRPGRPEDMIRTVAPTAWQGLDAPAPRFETFMAEIMSEDSTSVEPELVPFLARLFGYAVTGLTTEHVLPILWGDGRNGKDTLLETLGHVLGPLAASASTSVFVSGQRVSANAASPHLYDLYGRRLMWANETNEGARLNAAQVKLITGGGRIKARPLFGNLVDFQPSHLVCLVTNKRPGAPSDDRALWTRILLVPFVQRFVTNPGKGERQADKMLVHTLKSEASGILSWLVRGCLAWQHEGLRPPETVRLATEQYQHEEDDWARFIAECCVEDPDKRTKASELLKAFNTWKGGEIVSQKQLSKMLADRYDKTPPTKTGIYYLGIGLLAEQVTASI